jgi:MFS family permease
VASVGLLSPNQFPMLMRLDVCAQLSTLNFGIFFVYWIDYAFSSNDDSFAWRVPVILQCIFLIPMLFILFVIPESPRWLAAHGQADEALAVLQRLRSGKDDQAVIQRLHQDIVQTVEMEKSLGVGSWKDLLRSDRIQSRRRLFIACAIQSFQQLGGINAIICKSLLSMADFCSSH